MSSSEQESRLRSQELEQDRALADQWAEELAAILAEEEARFAEWWLREGAEQMARHYSEVSDD